MTELDYNIQRTEDITKTPQDIVVFLMKKDEMGVYDDYQNT